jgi:AcrR family transcriptional regulator
VGDDTRRRVLEGAYACVARFGFAKTTIDDVARAAGVSRATIYRIFPGGRSELLEAMVGQEMDRFFLALAEVVADEPDFARVLEAGLAYAHRALADHEVLQKVLVTEPELLLPLISLQQHRILEAVTAYLRPLLEREALAGRIRSGVDLDAAADYVARMVLSVMAAPGRFDLTDAVAVRSLVRRELLGGILTPE